MTDDDSITSEVMSLDLEDSSDVKELYDQYIRASVCDFRPQELEMLKLCISYYLTTGNLNIDRFFGANHIPLSAPDNLPSFLESLWKLLFGELEMPEIKVEEVQIYDF
jgi:hypothetical protein